MAIAAALRRRRRDRLGQLVEHPSRSRSWPSRPAARGCYRVNGADELPDDLHGTVGVTAGASAPEELVDAVIARLAPRTASRRCASPTRTSTSRRPATSATCRPRSRSPRPSSLGGALAARPARRRPRARGQRRARSTPRLRRIPSSSDARIPPRSTRYACATRVASRRMRGEAAGRRPAVMSSSTTSPRASARSSRSTVSRSTSAPASSSRSSARRARARPRASA